MKNLGSFIAFCTFSAAFICLIPSSISQSINTQLRATEIPRPITGGGINAAAPAPAERRAPALSPSLILLATSTAVRAVPTPGRILVAALLAAKVPNLAPAFVNNFVLVVVPSVCKPCAVILVAAGNATTPYR